MVNSSLRDVVTKDLLMKIHNGEFSSETIITESMLCNELNLSRTPVREALIELLTKGILEKVPRKGYRVREFDQKSKLNVYDILSVLDALAAKLSIHNLTHDDIQHMNELIDLMDIAIKYKNYTNYYDLQEKFHHTYIDQCDNPILIQLLDEVKGKVPRYTYYSTDTTKLFDICVIMNDEHRLILKLLEEKKIDELEHYLVNTHWVTKDFALI